MPNHVMIIQPVRNAPRAVGDATGVPSMRHAMPWGVCMVVLQG